MHPSTKKALTNKQPAPVGPAYIDAPSGSVAFRCASCGKYVLAMADGRLRPHYLHLVGREKRREAQHQCNDQSHYSTTN